MRANTLLVSILTALQRANRDGRRRPRTLPRGSRLQPARRVMEMNPGTSTIATLPFIR